MKKLVTSAALAASFLVARLVWNLLSAEPLPDPTVSDFKSEAAEIDAAVSEELAAGGGAPALKWLAEPENMLFEGDPQSVQALIEGFYAAGAKGVWFTGVEQLGGKNLSASIAVELPEDAETRARILRTEADFWEEAEPRPDVGQRYLEMAFD